MSGTCATKCSIRIDRECGLIRITMSDLLTLDDVAEIKEVRTRLREKLDPNVHAHLTVNDVRDLKIMPQETLAAFIEMLAEPEGTPCKIAFIVSPTLVRGQVMRAIGTRPGTRCFTDIGEAERWLLDGERAAA